MHYNVMVEIMGRAQRRTQDERRGEARSSLSL